MTKKTDDKELKTRKKDITPVKEKKSPAKKEVKKAQVKLPKLFKKTYTENQLQRKILKKIYIADDKKFVQNFFKEAGENKKGKKLYAIPKDTLVEKKEQSKLKAIAKEIKTQKGRIKLVPLAAAVGTIVLICFLFVTFKNRIIKNAIVNACESVFEAKCDIDSVDFRLFDASFKVHHMQIANKDQPMKNLFELERIALDFDLTALLRKRFVTDEIAVTGMQTNTDRTYSGDISAKLAAKKKQKANKEDSAFMKTIKSRSDAALDSMKASFQGVFDEYNPANIIDRCYQNLKTPEIATKTTEETKVLIEEYKNKPEEIQEKLKTLQDSYAKIQSINIDDLKKNPAQIPSVLKTVESIKNDAETLKKETDNLVKDVKQDFNSTQTMAKNLQTAITTDKNMITTEVNKITSLNIKDGQRFISTTLEGAGYQLLGKYYPYAVQAVDYLKEIKARNAAKEPTTDDKIKSSIANRAKGIDVYYKALPPTVWIKKLTIDGFNFSFNMTDVSSNMDYVGKPATGVFKIGINNIDHTGTVVVDTRTNTTNPLVLIDYNCDKLPLNIDKSMFGAQDIPGVPSINTNSNLDVALEIFESEGFKLTGTGLFKNMVLTAQAFEPEWVSTIYLNTLKNINEMKFQASCAYTNQDKLDLDFTSDIDKQFMNAFTKELKAQLFTLKTKAEEELSKKIEEWTNGAITNLGTFEEMYDKLANMDKTIDSLNKQIENKLNEIKSAGESKVTETVNSAKQEASKAATDYVQGLLKW